MTQLELEALVREIAADRDAWEHLVRHSREQREYVELRRDDDVADVADAMDVGRGEVEGLAGLGHACHGWTA